MNRKSILVIVLSALLCLSTACGSAGGSSSRDVSSARSSVSQRDAESAYTAAPTENVGIAPDSVQYLVDLDDMEFRNYGIGATDLEIEDALLEKFVGMTVMSADNILYLFDSTFPLKDYGSSLAYLSWEDGEDVPQWPLQGIQIGDVPMEIYLDEFEVDPATGSGRMELLLYESGHGGQSEDEMTGLNGIEVDLVIFTGTAPSGAPTGDDEQSSVFVPDNSSADQPVIAQSDESSVYMGEWEGMIVPVPDDFDYTQSSSIAPEQPDGNVYPDAPANAAIGGAATLDEAVRIHFQAQYDQDPSEWLAVIPQGFIDAHPGLVAVTDGWFHSIVPEEFLPGGMDSLTYTTEDLTYVLTEEINTENLVIKFQKYGVKPIDGLWLIKANIANGYENEILIVRGQGRYFSTYAFGDFLDTYDEDTDGFDYGG